MSRQKATRQLTSPEKIEANARHAKWLQMRIAGKTYRDIAEEEGVHFSSVQEAIARRLQANIAEPAAELRALELERLDKLLASVWGAAELGELESVEQARKLLADRRKLLGVDAPTKVEVQQQPTTEVTLEELRAILNSMGYDIVPMGER